MEKQLIFIHLPSRTTRHQERTLGKELLKIIKNITNHIWYTHQ